jgi:thiol:disulfide interchange protein DsbC
MVLGPCAAGAAEPPAQSAPHSPNAPAAAMMPGPAMSTPAADSAVAADPALGRIKSQFAKRFPDLDVTAVRPTPYPGLYEVQSGMDFIYTNGDVSWVMEGPLVDVATRKDMTAVSRQKVAAIKFDELPLDLAIKQVRGDGSRKVAIFEDPNCGYCKQLHQTLKGQTNLTIYTFLYPILAPDSKDKSRDIWCAAEPAAAWEAWMLRGKMPPARQCDAPTDKILALGQRLLVRGTPTMFFADGSRVSGALPLDELQGYLDKQTKKGG